MLVLRPACCTINPSQIPVRWENNGGARGSGGLLLAVKPHIELIEGKTATSPECFGNYTTPPGALPAVLGSELTSTSTTTKSTSLSTTNAGQNGGQELSSYSTNGQSNYVNGHSHSGHNTDHTAVTPTAVTAHGTAGASQGTSFGDGIGSETRPLGSSRWGDGIGWDAASSSVNMVPNGCIQGRPPPP